MGAGDMIAILLGGLLMSASVEPMPAGLVERIAYTESRSYRDAAGWHYVDRRRGSSGELGCCQMTLEAFRIVQRRTGWRHRFADLSDPYTAAVYCAEYLCYLREHTHSWDQATESYNAGLSGRRDNPERAAAYLAKVREAAGKASQ